MIVLGTSTAPQTVSINTRTGSVDTFKITENGTDVQTEQAVTSSNSGPYTQFNVTLSLEEGKYYEVECFNGSNLEWLGVVFCSDNIANLSLTSSQLVQYTNTSTDNDLIII